MSPAPAVGKTRQTASTWKLVVALKRKRSEQSVNEQRKVKEDKEWGFDQVTGWTCWKHFTHLRINNNFTLNPLGKVLWDTTSVSHIYCIWTWWMETHRICCWTFQNKLARFILEIHINEKTTANWSRYIINRLHGLMVCETCIWCWIN